ncbi:hypothetical protein ACFVG9_31510 [Saccharothrix carnea]
MPHTPNRPFDGPPPQRHPDTNTPAPRRDPDTQLPPRRDPDGVPAQRREPDAWTPPQRDPDPNTNRPDSDRPTNDRPDSDRSDNDRPADSTPNGDRSDTDSPDQDNPTNPDGDRPDIDQAHARHGETTPAGISHHRGDPDMGDLPHRVPPDPRYFTADVHVTPDGRARIGNHTYTPEQYGDLLRRNGWDGKTPIRLIGCDAGTNDFANRLSRHTGADVLAPTKPAWTDTNGRVYTSDAEIGPDGNRQPKIPPNGEWHTHRPDGTTSRTGDDGYAPNTPDSHRTDHTDADGAADRGRRGLYDQHKWGDNPATGDPWTPDEIDTARRNLLDVNDTNRMRRELDRLGLDVDPETIRSIKKYLFDSPGIAMSHDNYSAWRRLTSGRGSVMDAQFIAHEAAEQRRLRDIGDRTGFDHLGRNYDEMSTAQRAAWRSDHDRAYLEAHRGALEEEYDFLAHKVEELTNGQVPMSRSLAAVADRRAEGRDHMVVDGLPMAEHSNYPRWQERAESRVEIGGRVAERLGLSSPARLADVVEAVRRYRAD